MCAEVKSSEPLRVLRRGERDALVVKPAGQSSEAPRPGVGATADGALTGRALGDAAPVFSQTLIEQVRAEFGWPDAQLPHRLDRPTRGVVVVARDRAAVATHNANLRAGRWTKHYLARIGPGGALTDPRTLVGDHSTYLRREGRLARIVRSGGDSARLGILAVEPAPSRTGEWHALIRLDTGRYHQVRAMLASLGAPLVGDTDYSGRSGPFYLEHASLWLPELETDAMVRAFDAADTDREPVAPAIAAMLAAAQPRS